MSVQNSFKVSKKFKSPLKNDPKLTPRLDKNLIQEYQALLCKESDLDQNIADSSFSTSATDVHTVMSLLHQLNEIKDATQVVLGKLASVEGHTLKELHERWGLNESN